MSSKLKVGVIGVGGIARVHMPGWKDLNTQKWWPVPMSAM